MEEGAQIRQNLKAENGVIEENRQDSDKPLRAFKQNQKGGEIKDHQNFNFKADRTLKIEDIIRATYANPVSQKFPNSNWDIYSFPLHPNKTDVEKAITDLMQKYPKSIRKFDEEAIKLFGTSKLKVGVDKNQWIAQLKTLGWYGPFERDSGNYIFQTATVLGVFKGLYLTFLKDGSIFLGFLDEKSQYCGDGYVFTNN